MINNFVTAATFRSTTIDKRLVKTYVLVDKNGIILIIKRILSDEEKHGYETIRKFKNYFYIQKYISFKITSFQTITDIVEKAKSSLTIKDIIL
jgi:hypothetical protein